MLYYEAAVRRNVKEHTGLVKNGGEDNFRESLRLHWVTREVSSALKVGFLRLRLVVPKRIRTFAPSSNDAQPSLFHGVMVSTRVFGSLSPRSSRSGTTVFYLRTLYSLVRRPFFFTTIMKIRLTYDFCVDTDLLHLRIERGTQPTGLLSRNGNSIVITMPAGLRLEDPRSQAWALRVLTEALRRRAKEVLPQMVHEQATRFGLRYNRVYIKDVTSRWGSCSSLGNVNLSLWLLLAPIHLVEYVVRHELAHLNEMNHSARFWAQVDAFYGAPGRGKALEREMKAFAIDLQRRYMG